MRIESLETLNLSIRLNQTVEYNGEDIAIGKTDKNTFLNSMIDKSFLKLPFGVLKFR